MAYSTIETPNDKTTQYDLQEVNNYFNTVHDTLDNKNRDVDKKKELILSNIYSYKKHKAQNKLIFIVIIVCLIIITIYYTNNLFNYMNNTIYSIIMGTIIAGIFIYVALFLWDFSFRDNFNYDEYDYGKFGTINNVVNSSNNVNDYTEVDTSNCNK